MLALGHGSSLRPTIRSYFRPGPVSMPKRGSVSTSAVASGSTLSLETAAAATADNFDKGSEGTSTTISRQRTTSSPIPQDIYTRRAMAAKPGVETPGDSTEGQSENKARSTSQQPRRILNLVLTQIWPFSFIVSPYLAATIQKTPWNRKGKSPPPLWHFRTPGTHPCTNHTQLGGTTKSPGGD